MSIHWQHPLPCRCKDEPHLLQSHPAGTIAQPANHSARSMQHIRFDNIFLGPCLASEDSSLESWHKPKYRHLGKFSLPVQLRQLLNLSQFLHSILQKYEYKSLCHPCSKWLHIVKMHF